jgi:hypothetical protein
LEQPKEQEMRRCLVLTISLFPMVAVAQSIVIPAGTKIIGELDQQVTSNERDFEVGDIVRGHVWRPIVVDGYTVIETGSPMLLRISEITKRKIAGRGGDVEIQAVSVRAVDGTEIFLDGGYDKQGSHRTALSASLSALVFWPAIFIRGKEAVLEPGTLFDASVPADTRVSVSAGRPPTIRIGRDSPLTADVLYDQIDEKARELPLKVTLCAPSWSPNAGVTAVNDARIEPIALKTTTVEQAGGCYAALGTVDLKALSEHFRRGINRFTLSVANESTEVLLDIEM